MTFLAGRYGGSSNWNVKDRHLNCAGEAVAGRRAALSLHSGHQTGALRRFFTHTARGDAAMNQTILAFISALAIYGLSSFALPRPTPEERDDVRDIQSEETAEARPAPGSDDASVG
jgi:hypothetical protein